MKLKHLTNKWQYRLKELKDARINETDFSIKNILAAREVLIEEFLRDILEE